jgi:N-acetylneuraminic acid mutarotase
MKIKLLVLVFSLFTISLTAQWSQRSSFPGIARAKAASFMIGNKVYVTGGVTNTSLILKDFWEYDIINDSWLHKADFPGEERYGAAAFVINDKGYISTGGNDNGYLYDLWQYDPVADSWIQRNELPNGQAQHENQRVEAFSFVIGNKAYLGGGQGFVFGPNSTNNTAFFDLWSYNASNNTWTHESDIPDFLGRNMSIAVSINGKAYIGLGSDAGQTLNHHSFWEYDPFGNSWTAKSDFPGNFTADCGTFVLDSLLYLIGGVNLTSITLSPQVYNYNPSTDTWNALPNFNGNAIAGEIAVSNGSRAFAGLGYTGSLTPRNDFWEFTTSTGIVNYASSSNDIIVFPNPSKDFISIKSHDVIKSCTLTDLTGKEILRVNYGAKLNLENISAGIYNVIINYENGTNSHVRIVRE